MTHAVEMNAAYTATDEAVESRLGEETVILHLGSGTYFGLDSVGTRVWELLREGATPQAICATLREEFEGTGETLEADILGFIGQLAENRLITAADGRVMRAKLARALGLSPTQWADLCRAGIELARARMALRRVDPKHLASLSRPVARASMPPVVARVAWAVPAAASVVPWRSDCLVQALAARRWLEAEGIATALHLGARRSADLTAPPGPEGQPGTEPRSALEAHAWLTCGDRIVTGGDISGYVAFAPPASSRF